MRKVSVPYHLRGETLLFVLREFFHPRFSVKSIKRAIDQKLCRINGKVERFGNRAVRAGDLIEIILEEEETAKALHLIYEDSDFVVFDKPPGITCDSKEIPYLLVHRLDKETSGVLIAAKHKQSQEELISLFAKRAVHKEYLAIVEGLFLKKSGTFSMKIASAQKGGLQRKSFVGKEAITEWSVIESGEKATLLLCKPITGRTHQIRLTCKELGHPIVGDQNYGARYDVPLSIHRIMLHAWKISFKEFQFTAPLPEDFQKSLEDLHIPPSYKKLLSHR